MRSKAILAIAILTMVGCKGKATLLPQDEPYVRTTIALIRLRSSLVPSVDSNEVKRRLDSVYRKFSTSEKAYLAESKAIGRDVERAGSVYSAIKDSLGIK